MKGFALPGKMKGQWKNNIFKITGNENHNGWLTVGHLSQQTTFAISPCERFVAVPRGINLWLYFLTGGHWQPLQFETELKSVPVELCIARPWSHLQDRYSVGCATGDGVFRTFMLDLAAEQGGPREGNWPDNPGTLTQLAISVRPTVATEEPVVCTYIPHPSSCASKSAAARRSSVYTSVVRATVPRTRASRDENEAPDARKSSFCDTDSAKPATIVLLWADHKKFAVVEFTFLDDFSTPKVEHNTLAIVPTGNLETHSTENILIAGALVSVGQDGVRLVNVGEDQIIARDWDFTLKIPPPNDLSVGATSELAKKMVRTASYVWW